MQKNYSPRTIALFTATISFCIVFLVDFIFTRNPWSSMLVAAIIGFLVFGIVLFYIQEVLDKKINTIYKFINQTKAGKRESFYKENLLPRPSLQNVTEDVELWANKNSEAFEMLEKNEQYRKEFLQNLSHELKTPLFSMQGYVESLLNGALEDKAVNQKFLQNTANNIQRLTDLVNDLDEITKLESDQIPLQFTAFNLHDLIQNVFNELSIKAKEKHIELLFKNGSLHNRKVWADKAKITQVLTNLIDNAIKYGKENGKVTANIDKLSDKKLLVEITDDGFGIATEHLDRIFERFYRTDLARARKVGGSGLGLSICKHIIEAHHQIIHVRSQTNVGTTFQFTLNKA